MILCTFPGRFGDLLWALPALRALSRSVGAPVDLCIAGEFAGIVPLLAQQDYLGEVWAEPTWSMNERQPSTWHTPEGYRPAVVLHLGYRGWPQRGLPFETLDCLNAIRSDCLHAAGSYAGESAGITDAALCLHEPWIHVTPAPVPYPLAIGFTEAWFELKLGLVVSLLRQRAFPEAVLLTPPGSRWTTESPPSRCVVCAPDWLGNARQIAGAHLFLGDCSALHVLAVALGTPALVMEPMEARWNAIFWPLGMTGPQVTCVLGNDGKPTFDARHVVEALQHAHAQRST